VSRLSSVGCAEHPRVVGHRLEDRVDALAQIEAAIEHLADLESRESSCTSRRTSGAAVRSGTSFLRFDQDDFEN